MSRTVVGTAESLDRWMRAKAATKCDGKCLAARVACHEIPLWCVASACTKLAVVGWCCHVQVASYSRQMLTFAAYVVCLRRMLTSTYDVTSSCRLMTPAATVALSTSCQRWTGNNYPTGQSPGCWKEEKQKHGMDSVLLVVAVRNVCGHAVRTGGRPRCTTVFYQGSCPWRRL